MTGYIAGVAVGGLQPWTERHHKDFVMMGYANATWIRSDLAWEYLEPTQGTWQFDLYDKVVNDAHDAGCKYLAILHTVPAWANGGIGDYGLVTDPATLSNYAHQVAMHYLPLGINTFEIGNEVKHAMKPREMTIPVESAERRKKMVADLVDQKLRG